MVDINFILRKLGLHAKLKGYHYFSVAVRLILKDEDYLFGLTRRLYPEIAARYHTSPGCVDRDMRTAVQAIWEHGNLLFLQEISGYEFLCRPTTGELLDILVTYCQSQRNANKKKKKVNTPVFKV